MPIDLNKAKKFSEKLTGKVGRFLLENQKNVKIKAFKKGQDIVTNIDLQAENLIISAIEKEYPNYNIHSEEKGLINKNSQYTWYIDPLDGTKEYFRRIPIFNTTLSLWKKKEVLFGAVYRPIEKEFFWAGKGMGAFCNSQKASVSSETKFSKSFIYTYLPTSEFKEKLFKERWHILENIVKNCYRLRGASDLVTTLNWVACGRCEGFFAYSQNIWDVGAGILMVQEAGGLVSNEKGGKLIITGKKINGGIIASNGKIHKELIKFLK